MFSLTDCNDRQIEGTHFPVIYGVGKCVLFVWEDSEKRTVCRCSCIFNNSVPTIEAETTFYHGKKKNRIKFDNSVAAVNVKTGEIFKAIFPDKGPAMDVRSACHFGGCNEVNSCCGSHKKKIARRVCLRQAG